MGLNTIQNMMIGIVCMIIVVSGGMIYMSSFYTASPSLDSLGDLNQFNKSMNKAANVTQSVDRITASYENIGEAGILGWLDLLIHSVFDGMKALGDSLGFLKDAVTETAAFFTIPPVLVTLALLIIPIIIAFTIWSAIMKEG